MRRKRNKEKKRSRIERNKMIERGKSNDKKRMCHWELQSIENEISPKPKQKHIDGIDRVKFILM